MEKETAADQSYCFLTGADIWPDRVNRRFPGARFVARAAVERAGLPIPDLFAPSLEDEVWGILITVPGGVPAPGDNRVAVRTDDGRQLTAALGSGQLLPGDVEDVVAAARYWELPYQFVNRLRDAAAAAGTVIGDEEPRDDAVDS
jgi:hypothetical protein